jgi:hypothetical protein
LFVAGDAGDQTGPRNAVAVELGNPAIGQRFDGAGIIPPKVGGNSCRAVGGRARAECCRGERTGRRRLDQDGSVRRKPAASSG